MQAMGIREEHYIIICGNPPPDYAIAAFSVTIKITMHVIAIIVLALRPRNIKMDAVNDAKETQAVVYISTVLIVCFLAFNFTLEGYANVYGIAVGICIYLVCVTFLGFTFIPKVKSYKLIVLGIYLDCYSATPFH